MKILQLHNRYQIAGGEDGVVEAEHELLRSNGHEVELLAVSNDVIQGVLGKAIAAASAIYSHASKQQVVEAIVRSRPDVIHVHNFFPLLSPSVYDAARTFQIPVVQTLHNYRLICPGATLFRENQICETCVDKAIPIAGIQRGCYRNSKAQSAIVAAMISWHRWQKTWQSRVSAYIALTEFQKAKLVQGGLPADKIYVKPNFIFSTPELTLGRESFALFVGRLSEEKGVSVLIEAYGQKQLSLPLKIVGDGTSREALERKVEAMGLGDRITFLGRQDRTTVAHLMQTAMCLVFPSIWYEGFPLTIVEAFAYGLPVIVPNLGSMAEIVDPDVTGLHFVAGDAIDLATKIERMQQHEELRSHLSDQGQLIYKNRYTPETNLQQLMAIYHHALHR